MTSYDKITAINAVIKIYFDEHPKEVKIPAKDLMPQFIAAGIFSADHREGLPIRKVLRELDEENQLHLIPYVSPERKQKNTNWFFIRGESKI